MAGYFVRRENPFTQVANCALMDDRLTLRAKGLYAVIQCYINIPNFVLYKSYLKKKSKLGKKAFQDCWNELKNTGYLKQARIRTERGYVYEYQLLELPDETTPSTINIGLDGRVIPPKEERLEDRAAPEIEPPPFWRGFKRNPVQKGVGINNNDNNNNYEKIDGRTDAPEIGKEESEVKKQSVVQQKRGNRKNHPYREAALREIRDFLVENHQLPVQVYSSEMYCREAIRLLTHYYDFGAPESDDKYSFHPKEQQAYEMLVLCLTEMSMTDTPMKIEDMSVTSVDVLTAINKNIAFDEDGAEAFGLDALMEDVIEQYRKVELMQKVSNAYGLMCWCIWKRLYFGEMPKEPDSKIFLDEFGRLADFPERIDELNYAVQHRKEIREYLIENKELPFDVLESEIRCSAAVHLLTGYEFTYSNNQLEQAIFELFNHTLILMLRAEKPMELNRAKVTGAKVWEYLNKCIDFSDDPYRPFDLLGLIAEVTDSYRRAEMKTPIQNKIKYMQACIWSKLIEYRVTEGVIRETVEAVEE